MNHFYMDDSYFIFLKAYLLFIYVRSRERKTAPSNKWLTPEMSEMVSTGSRARTEARDSVTGYRHPNHHGK